MSNQAASKLDLNDPFDAFFREAEQTDAFWVSKAKLQFTEDMLRQMTALDMNKSELAEKLGVKPAQVTRLCSGLNNFTIDTMVRVARSLNCEFLSHLQPAGRDSMWIDVLKDDTERNANWETNLGESGDFKPVANENYEQKASHVIVVAA